MAKFPQKRSVNVAVPNKRRHDLSHAHITTTDFGRLKSIENRYMVPGDEFKCNIRSITRVLSSLPSPTFGSFNITFRGYFVPIRNIWANFLDYIKNQQGIVYGEITSINDVPYSTVGDFLNLFTQSTYGMSEVVNNPTSITEYDFCIVDSQAVTTYYKFTNLGRVCYDFCTSNRCNISFDYGNRNEKICVLPLIAFWKTYFDWIVPSRFIHNHADYIERLIDDISNGGFHVTTTQLAQYLVKEPLCYYMDDIYNTCTEYPFSEPSQQQDNIILYGPEEGIQVNVSANNFQQAEDDNYSGAYAYLSDSSFNMYTLQTLGKLQDLLNRNMIAGTKVQDWLLTEFGLRPSDDALHLSTYLGSRENSMAITDIMSTADTASQGGVALGSYGGKLNERFDFDFSYKAKEHGYFIITYELVPRTSYYQGKEPEYDMLDRFDFFQPEFDNQQGAPIKFGDFFFDKKDGRDYQAPNSPWGFNLQYARLKFANDVVSGDFRNRFGYALKSWFMARDMQKYALSSSDVDFIDEEFCLVKSKYQDWNYIFADTLDNKDHFVSLFYFDMPCMRPMKSITEGFEPEYKNSGKEVEVNFSGSVQ